MENPLRKLKMKTQEIADASGVTVQKLSMGVIMLLLFLLIVAIDVFAFTNSAVAMVSQVALTINRKYYNLFTYFLCVVCGGLAVHFSIPKSPDSQPAQPLLLFLLICLTFFAVGAIIVYKVPFLKQFPNVD